MIFAASALPLPFATTISSGSSHHVDARVVRLLDVEVVEVDLRARLADCLRPVGRASAVRRRRLPRHGDEDDERLGFGVWQPEDSGARLRGRVGIERHDAQLYITATR